MDNQKLEFVSTSGYMPIQGPLGNPKNIDWDKVTELTNNIINAKVEGNPLQYLVSTDTVADNGGRPNQMVNRNGDYINTDWQPMQWYSYTGPNTLPNNLQNGTGIREQINTVNTNAPQPFNYSDVVQRLQDLCNENPTNPFGTTSGRKKANNEPDPSIVINEETGERFKWIDGKLVNLDE